MEPPGNSWICKFSLWLTVLTALLGPRGLANASSGVRLSLASSASGGPVASATLHGRMSTGESTVGRASGSSVLATIGFTPAIRRITLLNRLPSTVLASPLNNAIFTAPATITLTATAADPDGTITKVEFFQGTTLLATDTTSPYTYTWASVAAGSYSLTARAIDNAGGASSSAAAVITVNPPVATYSLTASPALVVPGGMLAVAWTAPATHSSTDWVALYRIGDSNPNYLLPYRYLPQGLSGTLTFTAPAEAGSYEARVFTNNSFARMATSALITVTNSADTTPPTIEAVLPAAGPGLFAGEVLRLSAVVSDRDPSPVEYQFSIDGQVIKFWNASPTATWRAEPSDTGSHTLTVEVRDAGGAASQTTALYLYRKPPEPPP